ncbi:MAG: AAA family ATPase [Bacteroidetes bacterium]|nr:AAA family ATPase [Bacteroidota bacterium]
MRIKIEGIRSLGAKTQPISIDKMTVITGQNSSGKTSYTLGLKLLTLNLAKHQNLTMQKLFDINLDPSLLNPNFKMENLSLRRKTLSYTISISDELNDELKLIYAPRNDWYELDAIHYLQSGNPVIVSQKESEHHSRAITLLLGNIDPRINDAFEKAILSLLGDKQGKVHTHKEIFGKLKKSIEDQFPTPPKQKDFLDFYKNKGIHKAIAKKWKLFEHCHFVSNLQNLIFSHELFDERSYTSIWEHDNSALLNGLAQKLSDLNPNEEEMEYLKEAEGYTEYDAKVDDLDDPEELITEPHSELSSSSFIYKLHLIFLNLFSERINKQLNVVKEFYFETERVLEQKMFHLVTDNSYFFEAAKLFKNTDEQKALNDEQKALNEAISYFKIGNKIFFEEHLHGSAYMIYVIKNKAKINIGTLGSGHYYLIKLILFIYQKKYATTNTNIILTEPEAYLHPNLQSEFCKFLVNITSLKKININFIVETHSEYIIRNLQLQIAEKKISHQNCKIYFFENNKGTTNIKTIRVDSNGFFEDKFGSGFLDESQKAIENFFKVKHN